MTDELKPCPFCGSVGIAVISGKYTDYVSCESCGTQSAFVAKTPLLSAGELQGALNKNSAIAAWNTRPIEDALRAENDALLAQWASVPWSDLDIRISDDPYDYARKWFTANTPKEPTE